MNEHRSEKSLYRIGDYARFMGVSTDLLKHYEKLGLIHSETAENGYRYYSFQESATLLECMRLQTYGLSLREMHEALRHAPYEKVKQMLDTKIDSMEAHLRFQQQVINEHRRISAWMEMMQAHETRVIVKESEPLLFLPQSYQRDFIEDQRITELLPAWVDAMPMVKSCCRFPDEASGQPSSWGLVVAQSALEALKLPVNDVVQRIDGGRFVHVHYRHQLAGERSRWIFPPDIMEVFQSYRLRPGCSILLVSIMRTGLDQERTSCGWFCAPLAE